MKKFFLLLITLCISVNLMFSEEYDSLTVAQALEIGQTLAESEKTETTYVITGYVSAVDTEFGDNKRQTFWLADTEDSNASSNADGAIMVYNGKTSIEIRKGYKVCVTAQIQHYKNATIDAIETYNGIVTTILEASITGTCGENLVWSLNVIDSILTISGTGDMTNYSTDSQVPWYNNWRTIKSIMLSDSITSIGDYAFYRCNNLTSIEIPNSVDSIGIYAFYHCNGLTSIEIPNSVTSIGKAAFYGCSSLTSMTIPNSVTSIGSSAFRNCTGLTSVTIPNSVTSIGNSAFYYCSSLTSVTIPNSVTSIGKEAFYGCSSLTSVIIPNSVTSIGDYAFMSCTSLTSVVWNAKDCISPSYSSPFPNTVTTFAMGGEVERIPSYLCYGLSKLTSITIPSNVTYIGEKVFDNCDSLTSVVWNAKNSDYSSSRFPNTVTSFTIGDGVEVIPAYLCSGLSLLTSITIPNSVTTVGVYAFQGCTGLTTPVYNAHVFALMPNSYSGAYTILDGIESIAGGAFYGCQGLNSITIPASLTSIGEYAFTGCSQLKSIIWNAKNCADFDYYVRFPISVTSFTIGDEVEHIPAYLCSGMSQLSNITIPGSVTSIGSNAFRECDQITDVVWNAVNCNSWNFGSQVTSFTFGENVEVIPASLCSGMNQLTSIVIPSSVDSIGGGAFSNCSALTAVNISDLASWCNISFADNNANPLTNAHNLYLGGGLVTNLVIPTTVTNIKPYAFCNCGSLSTITIPENIASIGSGAFWGCSNIISVVWNAVNCNSWNFGSQVTSFTFGENVEVIPASLCSGMNQLTDIVIPGSVTSIGDYTFQNCTGLTSMIIPNSVATIGSRTFYGCTNLTSLSIPNSVTNNQSNLASLTSLTVVDAPVSFFDVQEPSWSICPKYLEQVTVNSGELNDNAFGVISRSYKTLKQLDIAAVTNTSLADEAFKSYYNLTSLALPEGLEYIDYMTVADCKSLQSIAIPASVTEIGNSAFEDCRSLSEVVFAENPQLERIGNWAFYNCHTLQNLTIPEGVTEIGDGAFYGCTYLEELNLPASVQSMGNNAFALCSKIKMMNVDALLPPDVEAKTFYEVSRTVPVYVPDESLEAYFHHPIWSELNIVGKSQAPSSISNIQSDNVQTTKILHNGQILILRGDKVYTLQGQEVK